MVFDLTARAAALIPVPAIAVVDGTDVFCAIALRPANGRALQAQWDLIIDVRAGLQGLAAATLCVALAI